MRRSTVVKIVSFIGSAVLLSCLVEVRSAVEAKAQAPVKGQNLQVTILSPAAGTVIPPVSAMSGTIKGNLPNGHKIYCFAKDQFGFYLMAPEPSIAANGKFKQGNIRCTKAGGWELHVVLADAQASKVIDDLISAGIFSSLQRLPTGSTTLDFVDVQVK